MSGSPSVRKPLVLCVEDNPGYLFLRRAILEQNGYRVIGANTGEEALNLLNRFDVSLVISDHLFSATTGADLAYDIRKIYKHLPVLLYAGAAPEKMGGANCFLRKDEDVDVFLCDSARSNSAFSRIIHS